MYKRQVIHGGNITTGNIQSANFSSSGGSFSTAGTEIRLADGQITAPEFSIDSTGNAAFKGNLTGSSGTFGGTLQIGGTTLDATNTLNVNTTKADVGLSNLNNPGSAITPTDDTAANAAQSTADSKVSPANVSSHLGGANTTTISGSIITTGTINANRITTNTLDVAGQAVSGSIGETVFASGTKSSEAYNTSGLTSTNLAGYVTSGNAVSILSSPLTITIEPTATAASTTFNIVSYIAPIGAIGVGSGGYNIYLTTYIQPFIAISTSSSATATGSWISTAQGLLHINTVVVPQTITVGFNITTSTSAQINRYVHAYLWHYNLGSNAVSYTHLTLPTIYSE